MLSQAITQTQQQGEQSLQCQRVHSGAQPRTGALQADRWVHGGPEVWTSESRDALAADFQATLARGVHGLCFSPYLEGQQPGDHIPEAQIRERLRIIRPYTSWVRSFSCTVMRTRPALHMNLALGRWWVRGWVPTTRSMGVKSKA